MIFAKNRDDSDLTRLRHAAPRRGAAAADGAPADSLPRFAIAATDDAGAAAEVFSEGSPARARLALADMLSASQPVTSRAQFSGRHAALGQLIDAIEQQRAHVVLYGERGIGKTSLVHIFAETARDAEYLVLYGSCGADTRFDELFRTFAEQIPLLYHSGVSPTGEEPERDRSFADLLGAPPVTPRELADLFGQIVGTRVVIILDEYDRVADTGFRRGVAELIKNLSDRAARMQLILTGVASNLDELIGFTPSIRRNIVGLAVTGMSEAELDEILRRAESASGMSFTTSARHLIIRMAGGSPYLVRLLGNRAAGRALDGRRMAIVDADVIGGTEAVLAEWNAGLPRYVQAILQRPQVRAAWPALIAAASASGTPDGWFSPHDVAAADTADHADAAAVQRTLDGFVGEVDLFDRQTSPDTQQTRYRFHTQGVAQLLGLSAALARAGR